MTEKTLGTLQIDFVLSLFGALDPYTDIIEKAFGVRDIRRRERHTHIGRKLRYGGDGSGGNRAA